MAAILTIRRGSNPSTTLAEPYFNIHKETLQIGSSISGSNITLTKVDGINTGSFSITGTFSGSNQELSGYISASYLNLKNDITASNLKLSGHANIAGNITLGGTIILGDSGSDQIVINAGLTGSLIPDVDNRDDLGSNTKRFKSIYVATASIDSVTFGGIGILSSSNENFTNFSSSVNLRLDNAESFSSSIDTTIKNKLNVENVISGSSQILGGTGILSSSYQTFNEFSSSADNRLDFLEVISASHDDRLDQLEVISSSHESRLNSIEGVSGSYATTGSNSFTGSNIFSGSLNVTGSLQFRSPSYRDSGAPYSGSVFTLTPSGITLLTKPSASLSFGVIQTYDNEDGNAVVRLYGKITQLGTISSTLVEIGNNDSFNAYRGNNYFYNDITASNNVKVGNEITASFYKGDGRHLINVTGSYVHQNNIDGTVVSGSSQIDVNQTQNFQEFSSSVDLRLDDVESFSSSIDTTIKNKLNIESVLSGSLATLTAGSGVLSSSNETFETFSSSVDSRLDNIEGVYSESVNNRLEFIESYTSSLKNAIDVNGQNLTVFGDLTVQGTTTTLNTTELVIEDKVLSLASGSTTSAQADGAGLHISGADVSILWKDSETLLNTNAKISSSVGFKGNGSELTGVTAASVDFYNVTNRPVGLVSGSTSDERISTLTSSLDYRYLMVFGDNVFSGSSQVDLKQTTNYVSGIKDRLNAEMVISSSEQVSYPSLSNIPYGIVSGSEQISYPSIINIPNGIISGSQQVIYSLISSIPTGIVSGSSQVDLTGTTNYISGIKERLNAETVLSGSNQVTSSLDMRYLLVNGDDVVSGSSQVDLTQTTNYISGIKNRLNIEGVISSSTDSSTIDFTITNGVISADVIGGIVSQSHQLTSSYDNRYEVSGSVASLVGIRTTSGSLGSAAWYNVSASIADGNPSTLGTAKAIKDYIDDQFIIVGAGDITEVIAGKGMSGGALSGSATLSLDTGSSHFTSAVYTLIGGGIGSLNQFTQSYYNDSQSFDSRIDGLEAFSSSLDLGYVTQTELATATGSLIDSIATKLNTGSYNNDSQSFDSRIDAIELFSTSLDNTFVTQTELGTATGSLINSIATKLNTGSYNTDSASFDTRLDILELYSSSNFVPTASFATSTTQVDVYVKNMSGAQINKGTVVKISGAVGDNPLIVTASYSNELGSANTLGITTTNIPDGGFGWVISEGVLLGVNTDGFNVGDLIYLGATGSFTNTEPTAPLHGVRLGQVLRVNQNNGSLYVRIDNGAELKELHNVIDTSTNSSYGDVLIKSGSVWVNNSTFSSSIDSTFVNLNAFSSSINTTIKNKLNNDSVLSGSLSTLTEGSGIVSSSNQVTSSLDTRYVNLSGSQTITGTKTFTDIVVNGTGSFARIESVTSQATIIGSSFVVVNTNTPTQRYAGLTVYDSGSTLSTASLYFDGQLNDWNYEYSSSAGIDYGTVLFGPTYGTKGSPTYPTSNKVQKGTGTHHLSDSNIIDNGTTITLGSNVVITGTLSANGIVSGSTFTSPSQGTLRATINGAQTDVDLGLQTTDEVQFAKVGVGGAADATYELKVTGDIGATGDIVAYISSDKRLKDEITPISNPLEKINKIGGYSFIWNEEKQNIYKGKDYGVIAQEIEEILPELVENRDNGYKAVKYDRLVSLLIEGIKELSNEVKELKNKLEK